MDYNDYMNMPAQVRSTGVARFVPAAVVISAFAGFVALAWYAYHNGAQSLKEEDLIVVEAEKTPMKEKPLDPGGMKFPNQDKTIFDNFAGGMQSPPRVERVLPHPEEPMARNMDTSQTTTWVNDKVSKPAEAGEQPVEQPLQTSPKVGDLTYVPPAETAPAADIKSVQGDDVKTYHNAVKPKDTAVAEQAVAQAPAKPAAKGTGKVQLGAYRSDKEARDAFSKIQKRFSDLAGKKPQVVKADLGNKGIFYRLRVAGVDAKSLCQSLSAKGQACMAVPE